MGGLHGRIRRLQWIDGAQVVHSALLFEGLNREILEITGNDNPRTQNEVGRGAITVDGGAHGSFSLGALRHIGRERLGLGSPNSVRDERFLCSPQQVRPAGDDRYIVAGADCQF
jgi:hypothetical protein